VKILGYAEILSQGTWPEVKTGQRLARGETLRTRRGGEATVTASDGKINLTVKSETTVTCDGLVDTKSRPWKDGVPFKPVSLENNPESKNLLNLTFPRARWWSRASAVVAGVTYTRDLTVTFGNWPLSAFSGLTTGK
jgi:hypothetical protein